MNIFIKSLSIAAVVGLSFSAHAVVGNQLTTSGTSLQETNDHYDVAYGYGYQDSSDAVTTSTDASSHEGLLTTNAITSNGLHVNGIGARNELNNPTGSKLEGSPMASDVELPVNGFRSLATKPLAQ
ncbi:MAG TPA: hypothetical protein VLC92_08670 [Rhodocyclaceae bacterium]|nr:hypothetical protein [Rhodocyclaceae bacterium]